MPQDRLSSPTQAAPASHLCAHGVAPRRGRWRSAAAVVVAAGTLVLPLLLGTTPAGAGGDTGSDDPAAPSPPVAVFAELDGSWAGTFVGYDPGGRELYRIEVRQTYTTVDENTQEVAIRDTQPDGTVVTGRGVNTARRLADGSLELTCRVEKSTGETVEHRGRRVTGPDGDRQLVWYSSEPGRQETFRERVRHEGEAAYYLIDGVGRYGDSTVLMAGRYRKQ